MNQAWILPSMGLDSSDGDKTNTGWKVAGAPGEVQRRGSEASEKEEALASLL